MAVTKKTAKPVAAAAAPVEAAAAAPVAASPFEAASEMLKPLTAMPEAFRTNAEQGIEKIREQYAAFKGNAESMTGKLEESFTAAQNGTRVFNGKVVDLFRAQVDAGFAHLHALFNATTVSEAMKLQQDFTKSQVEQLQVQSKDLADFAKQVAEQVAEPVKSSIVLPFKA